ncbi:MAG: UDP-N-acetylmuramoyl-L-alanyl-D-glutamate--2,6-diaminopimelate ligase [Thermoflexales bacterium]|nr:UDP-N-acetylmuramoyl-L-alanyl-D-glutamate--2,6-diaminopimelate ligase [Thermoflexales bacterium]
MSAKTWLDLLRAANLVPCTPPGANPTIHAVVNDSRKVTPGALFVAYRGVERDGHRYIADALQRGAVAVVAEDEATLTALRAQGVPCAHAPHGRQAFAWLCSAWHGFPSQRLTVIGVTGTDGKTTTTNLIFNILRAAGLRVGMISTVNAVIGEQVLDTGLHTTTPDADAMQHYLAQMRDAGMTHAVLEVTSHGLAQHRVDGTNFKVAVVTNITHDHLDLHGSREAYRAAKARLFEMAPVHVLNVDDDFSFSYLAALPAEQRIFYSREQPPQGQRADWWLYPLRVDHAQGHIEVMALQRSGARVPFAVRTSLIGDYNVSNILAAASAAWALSVPTEAIAAGVAAVHGIPGRMERIDEGQDYLAIVDFAHTPNALEQCLRTLRPLTAGRLIVVFGCAGERDVQKRFLMGRIAAELADVAIFTAEDPRREPIAAIFAEMQRGVAAATPKRAEVLEIADRGAAILAACQMARAGDTVVACGKGHEQSLCFGTTEYAWDDRKAMRLAIRGVKPELGPPVGTMF